MSAALYKTAILKAVIPNNVTVFGGGGGGTQNAESRKKQAPQNLHNSMLHSKVTHFPWLLWTENLVICIDLLISWHKNQML